MSSTEFNSQFDRVSNTLRAFAYSLTSDMENAKDLFQETAFRALKNKEKFRIGTNFKAWVMTMMKNIFINEYRMRRRRATQSEPTGSYQFEAAGGVADNMAMSELTIAELSKYLDEVEEQYRTPFLKYFNGYSYQEIADELGRPLGTIKSRIHHARKQLQSRIREQYQVEEHYT